MLITTKACLSISWKCIKSDHFISPTIKLGIPIRCIHNVKSRQEQRTKSSIDRVSSLLDSPLVAEDRNRPLRMRGKISKPLEKTEMELDTASKGMLEATGMDLMDVMNETLRSDEFHNVFKGTERAFDVVEIVEVKVNRDCSHAHALWKSKFVELFLNNLMNRTLTPQEIKIAEKMISNMTNILQRHEAKFRSQIIKTINFRRVPRVYFKHEKSLDDLILYLKEQNYVR